MPKTVKLTLKDAAGTVTAMRTVEVVGSQGATWVTLAKPAQLAKLTLTPLPRSSPPSSHWMRRLLEGGMMLLATRKTVSVVVLLALV